MSKQWKEEGLNGPGWGGGKLTETRDYNISPLKTLNTEDFYMWAEMGIDRDTWMCGRGDTEEEFLCEKDDSETGDEDLGLP